MGSNNGQQHILNNRRWSSKDKNDCVQYVSPLIYMFRGLQKNDRCLVPNGFPGEEDDDSSEENSGDFDLTSEGLDAENFLEDESDDDFFSNIHHLSQLEPISSRINVKSNNFNIDDNHLDMDTDINLFQLNGQGARTVSNLTESRNGFQPDQGNLDESLKITKKNTKDFQLSPSPQSVQAPPQSVQDPPRSVQAPLRSESPNLSPLARHSKSSNKLSKMVKISVNIPLKDLESINDSPTIIFITDPIVSLINDERQLPNKDDHIYQITDSESGENLPLLIEDGRGNNHSSSGRHQSDFPKEYIKSNSQRLNLSDKTNLNGETNTNTKRRPFSSGDICPREEVVGILPYIIKSLRQSDKDHDFQRNNHKLIWLLNQPENLLPLAISTNISSKKEGPSSRTYPKSILKKRGKDFGEQLEPISLNPSPKNNFNTSRRQPGREGNWERRQPGREGNREKRQPGREGNWEKRQPGREGNWEKRQLGREGNWEKRQLGREGNWKRRPMEKILGRMTFNQQMEEEIYPIDSNRKSNRLVKSYPGGNFQIDSKRLTSFQNILNQDESHFQDIKSGNNFQENEPKSPRENVQKLLIEVLNSCQEDQNILVNQDNTDFDEYPIIPLSGRRVQVNNILRNFTP